VALSREELKQAIIDTVRANEMRDGYIRVIISRGPGDLGLDPRKCPKATVVVIADAIKLYPAEVYEQGMECVTASTRRSRPDVLSPAIKSLNYLNHILAKDRVHPRGRAGVHHAQRPGVGCGMLR
jgi:branched-chain amino acid aminotransferase